MDDMQLKREIMRIVEDNGTLNAPDIIFTQMALRTGLQDREKFDRLVDELKTEGWIGKEEQVMQ